MIVVDGDEAANIVAEKIAAEPVIEVRDRENRRVANAIVRFTIRKTARNRLAARHSATGRPKSGRSPTLPAALARTSLTPLEPGSFEIEVEASYEGQTAKATIRHTNFATTADAKSAGREPGKSTTDVERAGATAAGRGDATRSATAPPVAAGGGMSKLAVVGIVAGGAAGAGAAVVLSQKSTDPPAGRVTAVTSSVTSGLQAATAFTFSVQATGFEAGSLAYRWEFGDGATATDAAPTHVYASAGTYTVVVTVSDARQSARSELSVSVHTLTGTWVSTGGTTTLQLTQSGEHDQRFGLCIGGLARLPGSWLRPECRASDRLEPTGLPKSESGDRAAAGAGGVPPRPGRRRPDTFWHRGEHHQYGPDFSAADRASSIAMRTLRRSLVILAAAATLGRPEISAQSSPALTLQQAVSEALVRNDRMLDHADTAAQADLDVRLARSAFGPKVVPNVFGSFGQTDVASQHYRVDVTQRLTTGTELRLGVGTATSQIPDDDGGGDVRFYNADTTLLLTQPLLRGFGTAVARRSLSSAELRQGAVERQREVVRRQVAIDAASAYYQLVAQHAFVAVARASMERGQKLLEATEAKLAAGLVSQLDVLRARQLHADAENQLADAIAGLDEGRDALSLVMGRDPGEPFVVDAEIPRVTGAVAGDVDAAVATALMSRTEMRNLADAVTEATARLAVSRNQRLPQVDLSVAMTRRQTAPGFVESFGLDGFRLATFFTVGMPMDRTTQTTEYQRALIERRRVDRERDALTRRITAEVRRELRQRDRLARAVAAAEASVDLRRQEVEVAQLRYDRGLSNNLDLVAAEGQLLAAEGRQIAALAQSAVQQLQLRAAMGILDPLGDLGAAARVPGPGGAP